MTYAAIRASIESRLSSNWTDTSVKYDNVPFRVTDDQSYIELQIHDGMSLPASTSGSVLMQRHQGFIVILIYVPSGNGTNQARTYADTAAAIFNFVKFSGIQCYGATLNRVGDRDGKFIYAVRIPFERDEDVSI